MTCASATEIIKNYRNGVFSQGTLIFYTNGVLVVEKGDLFRLSLNDLLDFFAQDESISKTYIIAKVTRTQGDSLLIIYPISLLRKGLCSPGG